MMDTRIKTAAAGEVLVIDDVINFIKYEDDDVGNEMSLIAQMIAAVRVHFERRTGLSFIEKTYETLFKLDDRPYILPVSPVISVDKVELVDYEGTKTELDLNSDYYKRGLYQVEIQTSQMTGWPNPWHSIGSHYDLLVTYKAGYDHDDTEPLPFDLKDAIKKQVMQWYNNRDDFYEDKILGSIDRILQLYKTKVF